MESITIDQETEKTNKVSNTSTIGSVEIRFQACPGELARVSTPGTWKDSNSLSIPQTLRYLRNRTSHMGRTAIVISTPDESKVTWTSESY